MPFPRGVSITVTRISTTSDGDRVAGESFVVDDCVIGSASKRSYETETYARDTTRADLIVFMPAGTDIRSSDTLTFPDATVWNVYGYPVTPLSPFTGWAPGIQVNVRRYTG